MNYLFLLFCTLLLGACEGPAAESNVNTEKKVITSEGVSDLRSQFELAVITGSEQGDQDPFWTPEALLPNLHSWFQVGAGLKQQRKWFDYVVYELRPIPSEVLEDLDAVLIPQRYSLAILTKSFWHEVRDAQKKGFRIVFISSFSPSRVSGVYFNSYKTIGLDIQAEPGTLPHELRHAEQYKKIDLRYVPETLSESCVTDMSRAFGEIDATTFELPLYFEIEKEFESIYGSGLVFNRLTFPQLTLLGINLNYPNSVSQKVVKNNSCPKEINETMSSLKSYFSGSLELLTAHLGKVTGLVAQKVRLETTLETNHCDVQNSDICAKLKSQRDNVVENSLVQKLAFENALHEAVENRRSTVAAELEKLPSEMQKDLCKSALGYSSFVNCEGYL